MFCIINLNIIHLLLYIRYIGHIDGILINAIKLLINNSCTIQDLDITTYHLFICTVQPVHMTYICQYSPYLQPLSMYMVCIWYL